jgi:hypothetical protein
MLDKVKKKQFRKHRKPHSNEFDEYEGYLGKENTHRIMRELRWDPEKDSDEP